MREVKQVTVYLEIQQHIDLKVLAARNHTSISQIIQELVNLYLKEKHEIT